ncbi:MAG TPA: hypothetical protein VGM06_10590 [Polyangiaceae bacterium]|jgi:hypothetical protein
MNAERYGRALLSATADGDSGMIELAGTLLSVCADATDKDKNANVTGIGMLLMVAVEILDVAASEVRVLEKAAERREVTQ